MNKKEGCTSFAPDIGRVIQPQRDVEFRYRLCCWRHRGGTRMECRARVEVLCIRRAGRLECETEATRRCNGAREYSRQPHHHETLIPAIRSVPQC